VGLESRLLSRTVTPGVLGKLLFSLGIILGCVVGVRFIRDAVDNRIEQTSNYVLISNTPVIGLPLATPLPTITPSPSPTASPPPLPAIRLSIPIIDVNASIQDIIPTEKISSDGVKRLTWEPLAFAVAHLSSSGHPGEGRNIVLIGHNNTEGEVFRCLDQLHIGDQVTLFTAEKVFEYQVQKRFIIPYLGSEADGDTMLQTYTAPQSSEIVTIISCWPYFTNAHRIIIIAVPNVVAEEAQ
jgi:LPXTG-site transpeptidase (sortase) family protein